MSAFHSRHPDRAQREWIKETHAGEEVQSITLEQGQDNLMGMAREMGAGPELLRDMKRAKLARKFNALALARMANG